MFTIASLFVFAVGSWSCEAPEDNSGEVAALLTVLVANGVILNTPDRGQCEDESEDGCGPTEGD
jgi:hypothetical protein